MCARDLLSVRVVWQNGISTVATSGKEGSNRPAGLQRVQWRMWNDGRSLWVSMSVDRICASSLSIDDRLGILAAIERTRIRKAFSLEGSIGSDCVTSLYCCCCVLIQNEREVRDREELIRRYAGPATGAGTVAYVPPGPMAYALPPR